MKELLKQLKLKFIVEIIKWLAIAIGAILFAKLTPEYISTIYKISVLNKWLLTGLLISIFTFLFIFLYNRYNKFTPKFSNLDFNFLLQEYELTHIYEERYKLIHRRRYKIKALKNGLDSYKERFLWTGGEYEMRNLKPNQQLLQLGNENLFKIYEVKFNRTLKKGDVVEVELEWTLYDKNKTAVPFVSSPIKEPTELLIINVAFPNEFNMKEVECEISYSHGSKIPIEYSKKELVNNGYSWKVENPKLMHHYEVRWFFKE